MLNALLPLSYRSGAYPVPCTLYPVPCTSVISQRRAQCAVTAHAADAGIQYTISSLGGDMLPPQPVHIIYMWLNSLRREHPLHPPPHIYMYTSHMYIYGSTPSAVSMLCICTSPSTCMAGFMWEWASSCVMRTTYLRWGSNSGWARLPSRAVSALSSALAKVSRVRGLLRGDH